MRLIALSSVSIQYRPQDNFRHDTRHAAFGCLVIFDRASDGDATLLADPHELKGIPQPLYGDEVSPGLAITHNCPRFGTSRSCPAHGEVQDIGGSTLATLDASKNGLVELKGIRISPDKNTITAGQSVFVEAAYRMVE